MLLSTLFNYQGNIRPLIPTGWTKTLQYLVGAGLLILFSSSVFSYPTYEGCKSCHGNFPGDPYVSNKDGSRWNTDLMDGHEAFVSGNCDACHKSGPKGEVFLNFSSDSTFSMGCIGCHGRSEDINNSCTGNGGGTEVNCGGGAGLRKHHETEVGIGTCSSCHSSDPSPVAENIAPFNYGKSGITMVDSCDADGTESQYGASGLDNDGDGLTDASDPDCQANTPPTQPGTLSASAITVNSATVSWVASTDADGDPITYLVEYRRNGDASWTSAGSTGTTSRSLSGLNPAQSYDVRVTPSDGMDTGPARTTLNLFQTDALNSAPTQPGTLSASAITADSATVSWVASTDADGDPITYLVEYRRNGDVPWTSAGSTGTTSRSLGGLDSGQPYDVRVTPSDGMDAGPARTTLNLFETVFVNTPPTQPGPLSATSVTSDSAVVNWVASTDVDDDAITYLVEYRRNGEVPWTSAGSTSNTSQSLSGLDPAQSYDVQVTPNDATDDGTPRTALNLFQTFAAGEIIFNDGFEGVP